MESYHDDSRGSDARQCGRCFLMQPGDEFMDKQYGPVGNSVNVCSDCLHRAFSERVTPTLGIHSAVETDADATMVQEDDDRPPCLDGGGASEKELLTRGATPSASSVAYPSTNDSGNNNNENTQNHSSPSKRAIGSKRKGSPRSTLPLSPHKASGRKLSLLNDHSQTNTSSYCSSLLSTPIQAASTPVTKPCQGVYCGATPQVLIEVAKSMESNAQRLRSIANESDDPITCPVIFAKSDIGTYRNLLPNHNGTAVLRAEDPTDGYVIRANGCTGFCSSIHSSRCSECDSYKYLRRNIRHRPNKSSSDESAVGKKTNIKHIASDRNLAEAEIRKLRKDAKSMSNEVNSLRRKLAFKDGLITQLYEHGKVVPSGEDGMKIMEEIRVMNEFITNELPETTEDAQAKEMWTIMVEHMVTVASNGGKGRGRIHYHPDIIRWATIFLARTSKRVYNEVAKLMMLPDVSYIYRETAKIVSTAQNIAYGIHINAIESLSKRANEGKFSYHQRCGVIAQDSASVSATLEHDHVSNTLKGGDQSQCLASCSRLFLSLVKEAKVAGDDGDVSTVCNEAIGGSIMDNVSLADEHLVFYFNGLDPDNKVSEIVASVNVKTVTAAVITQLIIQLRDTLAMYGLFVTMATSDAAGCNWVSYGDSLSTHTFRDALPTSILQQYPTIDYDVRCLMKCPVTGQWIIFVPDMPHLMKCILTCLELSSSLKSNRRLMFGKCPVTLGLIQDIWLAMGGNSAQLQPTKLTYDHFVKNAYSRMKVSLAVQVLSGSVATMITEAMEGDVILPLREKGMYQHVRDLCRNMNMVVDICNGRDGPHTPDNAAERQKCLLEILQWFSQWKALHDERLKAEDATEFNFFAKETWFCIRALLLSHVTAIQMYCIEKGEKINPRSMNTDAVELHFGNVRQMVGGSHNKITAAGFDSGDRKSSMCKASMYAPVGNNSSTAIPFDKKNKSKY